MTATYTFDVYSTLDGYGSYSAGDWGGYWGKQGPEFLERRLVIYGAQERLVLGANTYREMVQHLGNSAEQLDPSDPNSRLGTMPLTVVSGTLEEPLDWPGDAEVARGDALEVVARLKDECEMPLRSHGSLSMNRALMAAGLVDRVQVTIFPAITSQTGSAPIFHGGADFDLELLEHRTFDGRTQELIYRPTKRGQDLNL